MALIAEKVVVTAKEFLTKVNCNDSREYNEPIQQAKLNVFGWDLQFSASSLFCEIVWKISVRGYSADSNELDRLFSPSPVATYCNFRGNKNYKSGNQPELGALVFWKRGNSWQGHMGIVIGVSEDKRSFDIAEGRALVGSEDKFINVQESKDKRMGLPFCNDKLNLLGFVYPKNQEIR